MTLIVNRFAESPSNGLGDGQVALILLIDDDGFYRSVIRQILEDGGHQVVEAQDGPEGLGLFRTQKPDLVITDMRMPGFDGGEVIRHLRRMDSKARIVAVSGAATFYNIDYMRLAKDVGADAILRKLDPLDRVLIEINEVLNALGGDNVAGRAKASVLR
jgi:CheY-like chemotaxis protein